MVSVTVTHVHETPWAVYLLTVLSLTAFCGPDTAFYLPCVCVCSLNADLGIWHTNVSWWVLETHLFGVKRSKVKVTSQTNSAGV